MLTRKFSVNSLSLATAVALSMGLTACGGGGGGGGGSDDGTSGAGGGSACDTTGGSISFTKSASLGSGTQSTAVALADLDNDGDLDAWVTNSGAISGSPNAVWLNKGSGNFSNNWSLSRNKRSEDVAVGLFNSDTRPDAVVANENNQGNAVYIGTGKGDFSLNNSLGSGQSKGVALGKVDGDGTLDIFAANGGSKKHEVWTQDGNLTDTSNHFSGTYGSVDGAGLADLNNDGHPDALVVNDTGQNRVYFNGGSGSFGLTSSKEFGISAADTRALATGDLDGNNGVDVVTANFGDDDKVWLNDGSGNLSSNQSLSSADNEAVAIADFNNDGAPDVVIGGTGVEVYLNDNDGTGNLSGPEVCLGDNDAEGLAIGDLNGDSKPDIFVANNGQNNTVWTKD